MNKKDLKYVIECMEEEMMIELQKDVDRAKTFGELNSLMFMSEFFLEFKENEYAYYKDWFMDLDNGVKDFATISNSAKIYDDEKGEYLQFHITTEFTDDIAAIQNKIKELEEMLDNDEISVSDFYKEVENLLSSMKIKNSRLERV